MKAGWREVSFDDSVEDATRGQAKTPQLDYQSAGPIPLIDQGKDLVGGFTDECAALSTVPLPVVIFGDHTRCIKYVDFPFGAGADGVKILRARDGVDPRYLYQFMRSIQLPNAGYSRHFKYLREVTVPLPPIEEQRRIAAVLDAADALRAKRRQALAKLDTLTQATFIDMFGDPQSNPRKWQERTLGSLATKFSDGPFGSNLKSSHYVGRGVRVIRLQNIGVGRFLGDDCAFVSESHFERLRKHECLPGDVLVGTLGDPNLRACVQPHWLPVALNKADCVQIRPDPGRSNAEWLCALINCPQTLASASDLMTGQTRVRISMGRLRNLVVPVPPIDIQHEFAERVRSVAQIRDGLAASLAQLDALFESLQHRAFRGEL